MENLDFEKINRILMDILEDKYNIKIETKVINAGGKYGKEN